MAERGEGAIKRYKCFATNEEGGFFKLAEYGERWVWVISDILNSTSILKLKQMLAKKYGKSLLLKFIDDVTQFHPEDQGYSLQGQDLLVPISARGEFLATAIVPSVSNLSQKEHSEITDLLRVVLEPTLSRWRLVHGQVRLNESFDVVLSAVGSEGQSSSFERAIYLSSPYLVLECRNPYTIQKVAHKVHEITNGWAQLRFKDIKNQIKSERDFKDLGPMTVIVEDLLLLSPKEQALLARFEALAEPNEDPLLVIGSTMPLTEMLAHQMIDKTWGLELLRNLIPLDKLPAHPSLMQESLELILDRRHLMN